MQAVPVRLFLMICRGSGKFTSASKLEAENNKYPDALYTWRKKGEKHGEEKGNVTLFGKIRSPLPCRE